MITKLISIVVATFIFLTFPLLHNKQHQIVPSPVQEQKLELPIEQTQEPVIEKTEEQLRAELIVSNPKGCNTSKQYILWPDGECKAYSPATQPNVQQSAPKTSTGGSCDLAYNYDWPQSIAYQICKYESGGNPNAANLQDNHMSWAGCMGSFGLMQINCSHGRLYDGNKNMEVAYSMYKSWGNSFRAWTTCAKVTGCK
jgi:hypothetical protein